jgi:hypothetical protein
MTLIVTVSGHSLIEILSEGLTAQCSINPDLWQGTFNKIEISCEFIIIDQKSSTMILTFFLFEL